MRHLNRAPRARPAVLLCALAWCAACADGAGDSGGAPGTKPIPLDNPTDVGDACATERLERLRIEVELEGIEGPCPFGEGDNAPPTEGLISARIEQRFDLALPPNAVICDLAFSYGGESAEQGLSMRYDDQFFFTFGGALLASSDVALVELLPKQGVLPVYDWPSVLGAELNFFDDAKPWCLGAAEGLASCEIPVAEEEGLLRLDFSQSVINELSYRAIVEDRLDFGFVTMGDNDDTDCSHDPVRFTIEVPFFRRQR